MEWSLHDARGRRKYLVEEERVQVLRAALSLGGDIAGFCAVLVFCGVRISEALSVTSDHIDIANCTITFETLKRRRRGVMRVIPVPRELISLLRRQSVSELTEVRLWRWSRTTAWRKVKAVMISSGISPHLAKPKALRHAFAAQAASRDITLTMVKKWMGHARIETTEIYTQLVGDEERALIARTWMAARREGVLAKGLMKSRTRKTG